MTVPIRPDSIYSTFKIKLPFCLRNFEQVSVFGNKLSLSRIEIGAKDIIEKNRNSQRYEFGYNFEKQDISQIEERRGWEGEDIIFRVPWEPILIN